MELYVVIDRAFLGKGVFAVFSTREKAEDFVGRFERETANLCDIMKMGVTGLRVSEDSVFAAHAYNDLYDTFFFDGIYDDIFVAYEAVGSKGLIVRCVIDGSDEREIVRAYED